MRIIINGANGNMGQNVALAAKQAGVEVAAGVDHVVDRFKNSFPVYDKFEQCPLDVDVVVDFSLPAALPGLLAWCKDHKIPAVIATTGMTPEDKQLMADTAQHIPVFNSANMSLGVNLQRSLAQTAATFLGEPFEIEIIERHHHRKVDAPSGTALLLGDAINEAIGGRLEYVYDRHTKREKRKPNELGFHAIRGGTIVGEHEVLFIGPDEVVEIKHSATSRQVFAQGALRAAAFIMQQQPGLYSMTDIVEAQHSLLRLDADSQIALITVREIDAFSTLVKLFDGLAKAGLNLDMISQTTPVRGVCTVSFTLPIRDAEKAHTVLDAVLKDSQAHYDVDVDAVKVSLEGPGMEYQAGVASKLFAALHKENIPVLAITTSETKIACCIAKPSLASATAAIKELFSL